MLLVQQLGGRPRSKWLRGDLSQKESTDHGGTTTSDLQHPETMAYALAFPKDVTDLLYILKHYDKECPKQKRGFFGR